MAQTATPTATSTTLFFGPWYRRSPFFEATLRYGCTAFDIYNHTYLPAYYDDPVTEYWHLLRQVTIWDVGVERQVEITGPDAFEFTNMLTCRDLTTCRVGQCKYAPIIDDRGGILNDPILLRLGERHFWLSIADSDILLWARGVALHSGMDVEIGEPDVWPVQVQGPHSRDVMDQLFGEPVMALPYYFCTETETDGIPVVVSRTGWTGEVGYEIYLRDSSRGDDLWERIMAAGKPFDIRPIAPCETRRLEGGIFNYGSDFTWENNPLEVTGMERLVELDQEAGFIGRDALRRIAEQGVTRKLVGVQLSGGPMEWELTRPWPVLLDGRVVGRVTDAIHSPRLERNIGYAWVPIEAATIGTTLQVDTPEGEGSATVARLPFIDPGKRIPKS